MGYQRRTTPQLINYVKMLPPRRNNNPSPKVVKKITPVKKEIKSTKKEEPTQKVEEPPPELVSPKIVKVKNNKPSPKPAKKEEPEEPRGRGSPNDEQESAEEEEEEINEDDEPIDMNKQPVDEEEEEQQQKPEEIIKPKENNEEEDKKSSQGSMPFASKSQPSSAPSTPAKQTTNIIDEIKISNPEYQRSPPENKDETSLPDRNDLYLDLKVLGERILQTYDLLSKTQNDQIHNYQKYWIQKPKAEMKRKGRQRVKEDALNCYKTVLRKKSFIEQKFEETIAKIDELDTQLTMYFSDCKDYICLKIAYDDYKTIVDASPLKKPPLLTNFGKDNPKK